MQTSRTEREKKYHNERFTNEVRQSTGKFYKITYDCKNLYKEKIFFNSVNKKLLELGCSKGYFSIEMLKRGIEVTGIDISDVAVDEARKNAAIGGFKNYDFKVMDAAELNFQEEYFDKVVGGAILHHLDFEKAVKNISRILKPNGSAIFLEPLGYNPFINLYRKLTPNYRSVDEQPLRNSEMKIFFKYFNEVSFTYFYLTTLLSVPFHRFFFFKKLVKITNFIDKILFKLPFFRMIAWQVVIEVKNPKKFSTWL